MMIETLVALLDAEGKPVCTARCEVDSRGIIVRMKNPLNPHEDKPSFQKALEASRILHSIDYRQEELDIASLQRVHVKIGEAIILAQHEAQAGFSFGKALELLKDGKRVARRGWNGKGMWIFLTVPALSVDEVTHGRPMSDASMSEALKDTQYSDTQLARVSTASVAMRTATGDIVVGWLASQTDMLADDWHEVTEPAKARVENVEQRTI